MFTEFIEPIVVLLLVPVSLVASAIYIYSLSAVLPYVRGGRWAKIFFLVSSPKPDRVDQYMEPNGVPHYRRLRKAFFWFLVANLCLLALEALRYFVQS